MAFIWTDDMGRIGPTRELEDAARAAVIAGVDFLATIEDATKLPLFTGGRVLIPKNDAANAFVAAVVAKLPPDIGGIHREEIISTAVSVAFVARAAGGGDKGWAAVKAKINGTPKPRG